MSDNEFQSNIDTQDSESKYKKKRKPYSRPKLDALGDLRALTLGGSPGLGDSGNEYTENPRKP